MNNKIRLSNFFNAGGVCEVRLIREVKYINEDLPLIYYANSIGSFQKLLVDIKLPYIYAKLKGINNFECYIECMSFSLNGISYDYNKDKGLNDNMYLYAIGKYYRGVQTN